LKQQGNETDLHNSYLFDITQIWDEESVIAQYPKKGGKDCCTMINKKVSSM